MLVGDIDNDGDPDVYVINEGTHNRLYANGGSPHGWLRVTARGVISNPDAIGARLTAWVGGRSYLREVNGTAGMSYSSCVTLFGGGGAPSRFSGRALAEWRHRDPWLRGGEHGTASRRRGCADSGCGKVGWRLRSATDGSVGCIP